MSKEAHLMIQHIENTWQLNLKPLGVQEAALRATGTKSHIAWFIEQGLGKTHLTLSDYIFRYKHGFNDLLIIMCPNSLKYNWYYTMQNLELDKSFDIQVWPKIGKRIYNWSGRVIIINYEATIGKGFNFLQDILRKYKTYIVFDESSYLFNAATKRTNNAIHLAGECTAVRLLNGTPAPNGPHELYGQLRCIRVRVPPSPTAFKHEYCEFGYVNAGKVKIQVVTGSKNEKQLARLIGDKAFYADKATWAPYLPKKIQIPIHIEMTEQQKRVYRDIVEDLITQIDKKTISVKSSVGAISKLQQISAGYILDKNLEATDLIAEKENPKLEAVKEIIKGTNSKILIFGFYQSTIKLLIDNFPGACKMLGKHYMKDEELEEQKRKFNTDNSVQLMIMQQEVGKFGHTLLGSVERPCDTTVYFENRYSLLSRQQSEDRNNREGAHANHKVNLYYDIVASNIDQRVIQTLANKREISEELVDELRNFVEN